MSKLKFIALCFVLSALAGCATGAKTESMVYEGKQLTYPGEIDGNISFGDVAGGKETNPLWMSQIDNDAFSTALLQSLKNQGLYNEAGRYELTAELLTLRQPTIGLNLKVTAEVRYQLVDIDEEKLVLEEVLSTPFTASFGSHLLFVERVRLANEGAARSSIEALLKQLAKLEIGDVKLSMK